MNFQVWKVHYGGGTEPGNQISETSIWKKILEAPDTSELEIQRRGEKIGYARWVPAIIEPESPEAALLETAPEGMVRETLGYSLGFDGNFRLNDHKEYTRFSAETEFSKDLEWKEISARYIARPSIIDLKINSQDENATFAFESETLNWKKSFDLTELQNPQTALAKLGLPWAAAMFDQFMPKEFVAAPPQIQWRAFNDRIRIGRSSVRAYRVVGTIADRYEINAIISRAGELLQVDFPGEIRFVNEAIVARK